MTMTIYHNPKCSRSRKVLKTLRDAGMEPSVVEYMKTPPSREELVALVLALDLSPREMMRHKDPLYDALGLSDETLTDRQLLDAMLEHPELMERPIVIAATGAVLCRPKEKVLDLLARQAH